MRLVAIDPGHGMANARPGVFDPGAVAFGKREADIALAYALSFKHYLHQRGIKFLMLRSDNLTPCPLRERIAQANRAKVTDYVSFHCNASLNPLAHGTETLYRDAPDKVLADIVQDCAVRTLQLKDRGVKHERQSARGQLAVFGVNARVALVELGFITNPTDLHRMLKDDVRRAFTELLASKFQ